MAFHPVDQSLRRLLPCLLLLGVSTGCEVLVRATLAGLQSSGAREQASTTVPFEKTPWVDHGRMAQPSLLAQKEGTLEVRFVRDQGFPNASLLVSLDGKVLADFWEKEALALWLPPGRHHISCLRRIRADQPPLSAPAPLQDPSRSTSLELDMVPGPVPCIRLAITGSRPSLSSSVPARPTSPSQ